MIQEAADAFMNNGDQKYKQHLKHSGDIKNVNWKKIFDDFYD